MLSKNEYNVKLVFHKIKQFLNINRSLGDKNISKTKYKNKQERKKINKYKNILANFKSENIMIFLIYLILTSLFINCNKLSFIKMKFSNITLKIKGIGNKNILDSVGNFHKDYFPNIIYINGVLQNEVTYSYYFNQTDNLVKLVWYNNINFTEYMFSKCSDIYEIDFSNFDTSEVTNMNQMFFKCSSLSSLNLSNFDTSLVTHMKNMFENCVNLEYINLKNFKDTNLKKYNNIFSNVPENVAVCIVNNTNKITKNLAGKGC